MSWLSSGLKAIGGLVKPVVGGKIGTVLGGAIAGPAGAAIGGLIGSTASRPRAGTSIIPSPATPPSLYAPGTTYKGWKPGLDIGDVLSLGFGPTKMTGGGCPRGYHPSKRTGKCVRNRRMNYGNGRATKRAIRRIKGAEKQYRQIFTITHAKSGVKIKAKRRR